MRLNPHRNLIPGLFLALASLSTQAFGQSSGATIAGHIKIDNFGYRTTDTKIAYFTENPGTTVGVYNASTSVLAYSVPAANVSGPITDSGAATWISGDTVWQVNFSALTTAGTYYVYSASLTEQSYNFQINDCIYQAPMSATLKALYYQRCGCAKPAQYAGADWSDAATCHTQDAACQPAPGCTFPNTYGTLNLMGGWHDAGDYNKYIGETPAGACATWGGDSGEAIHDLMTAYEWNPTLFAGITSNIPESGNGNPDILNEAKWELDWYLKMQMTDYHVLSVVHQTQYTTGSPPSTDTTTRYYYPPNVDGEAQFVAMLSHSARVMSTVSGMASYAVTLRTAAENTWNAYSSTWTSDDFKFWAAAEIFRMEEALGGPASITSAAQSIVDNYQTWSTPFYLNEDKIQQNWGILAYMQATGATASVVGYMKTSWGNLVNDLFNQNDVYNSGMHTYDYYWGADEVKMNYATELLWAAKLGATGTHTAAQCTQHAEDFLHYMNGANPINMTLMTNSAAIGASHGIWRIYHSWFGNYGVAFSFDNFIGKPASVVDPLYPYYAGTDNFGISDSGPSTYGPPPGIVPDGPSDGYFQQKGQSIPPLLAGGAEPRYEKDYRDWDWVDPNGDESIPWVVNETGLYYTASYMVVASAFTTVCSTSSTSTPTFTATNSATRTPTTTASNTPSNTATFTATPTRTTTATPTLTTTATSTSSNTPTDSMTPTASPTATPSASPTSTSTATLTRTNTPVNTPTNTVANTPTNSATNSQTNTDTSTPSSTPTNTATLTPTRTATDSTTPTPTSSATPTTTPSASPTDTNSTTPTATHTPTASFTATQTDTATISDTPTNTQTGTLPPTYTTTLTGTPTSTFTATNTPTNTPTSTATNTLTASPSSTPTGTLTGTNTSTATMTATDTTTSTATTTSTHTPTNTPTETATATLTSTPTDSMTATPTLTGTSTHGATATPTATNSFANTSTFTATLTPTATEATVNASSNAPANSTQLPGATQVAAAQVQFTTGSGVPVTLTQVSVSVTGSGNMAGISQLILLDNGEPVATATVSAGEATFTLTNDNTLSSGAGLTYTVEANFNAGASGTYVFTMGGAQGTNGQAAQFTGLPSTAATTVTVGAATPTASTTPTNMATATAALKPVTTMVIGPNPATGTSVNIYPPLTAAADVRVGIFTTAFRKVLDETFPDVPAGTTVTVILNDQWGHPLADGLYYVVVNFNGRRSISKLLIFR